MEKNYTIIKNEVERLQRLQNAYVNSGMEEMAERLNEPIEDLKEQLKNLETIENISEAIK